MSDPELELLRRRRAQELLEDQTVSEEDLLRVLEKIRDLRLFTTTSDIDPWAIRQGLIIALVYDTDAALERGVPRESLDKFDAFVREDAQAQLDAERARMEKAFIDGFTDDCPGCGNRTKPDEVKAQGGKALADYRCSECGREWKRAGAIERILR